MAANKQRVAANQ